MLEYCSRDGTRTERVADYILQDVLGTGSFGQVVLGVHHKSQERVAIKVPCHATCLHPLAPGGFHRLPRVSQIIQKPVAAKMHMLKTEVDALIKVPEALIRPALRHSL